MRRAHVLATKAHEGQLRLSGEPYITHPVAVATIIADLGLDTVSAAAALLHDAVEDTGVTLAQIEEEFGPAVAAIVDGVTKLDRLRFDSKEAQQAATMRKMLVAMASDWRVLVIKLADRLHNMRTLSVMPEWKQRRTAEETRDIYAPLAHRLGIQEVKWQLEDLAFETLHPKRFAEIAQMVATRAPRREGELAEVLEVVRSRLGAAGIEAEVTGRPKNLWSIYEKMVVRGKEFDEIHDLVAIRVIVTAEKDCWAALGTVHALWPPVQGRFKDYINSPKFNLYQSLHTTVVGPRGQAPRDPDPHPRDAPARRVRHRRPLGLQGGLGRQVDAAAASRVPSGAHARQTRSPGCSASSTGSGRPPTRWSSSRRSRSTSSRTRCTCSRPKGLIVTLPAGATPVDFAYAIHTEVGHRCVGARVNGRLLPLDSKLHSGDTVEIVTSKTPSAGPSRDWLQIVASPRARNKIRQWFSRERREDAIETGREELARALRRGGLPVQKLAELARAVGRGGVDGLHRPRLAPCRHRRRPRLGPGPRATHRARAARRRGRGAAALDGAAASAGRATGASRRASTSRASTTSWSGCPGAARRCRATGSIGFVTRGRGVSVHREDCANAIALAADEKERLIEVEWDEDRTGVFVAAIEVKALDRNRLLADVAKVLSEHHVSIISSSTHTTPDRVSRMRFEFELADPEHLDSLLDNLRLLDSVYDAYRLVPGRSGALAPSGG